MDFCGYVYDKIKIKIITADPYIYFLFFLFYEQNIRADQALRFARFLQPNRKIKTINCKDTCPLRKLNYKCFYHGYHKLQ